MSAEDAAVEYDYLKYDNTYFRRRSDQDAFADNVSHGVSWVP